MRVSVDVGRSGAATPAVAGSRLAITVLVLAMVVNYMDRAVIAVLLDSIGKDLGLPDTALGLLAGLPFALLYALVGVPFARVADAWDRRKLIAIAVAGWSLATMACGLATGLASLFLMRVLVGIGEGAGTPALHSSLAELISPERRPFAASLFVLSGVVGGLLGFAFGGVLNEAYGWRVAFMVVGAPGLLIALLVWLCVPEPRAEPRWPSRSEVLGEQAIAVFARFWALPTFRYLVAGFTLAFAAQNGVMQWAAVFLGRAFERSAAEIGPVVGGVILVPSAIATLVGGVLGTVCARRYGIGWLLGLPALSILLATPCYLVFALAGTWDTALLGLASGSFCSAFMMPPLFAAIYSIARSSDRATVVALVAVFTNILGLGLGPLAVGALSDSLSPEFGKTALAYAMAAVSLLTIPGGILLALAARGLKRDASGE